MFGHSEWLNPLVPAAGSWTVGSLAFCGSWTPLKMQKQPWLLFRHRHMYEFAYNLRGPWSPDLDPLPFRTGSHSTEHFTIKTLSPQGRGPALREEEPTFQAATRPAPCRAFAWAGGAGQPPNLYDFLATRMAGAQRYWTCRHLWL